MLPQLILNTLGFYYLQLKGVEKIVKYTTYKKTQDSTKAIAKAIYKTYKR